MRSFATPSVFILLAAVSMTAAGQDKALDLAATGHCSQAVPLLYAEFQRSSGDQLKTIGLAGVKCGLAIDDTSRTVYFLSSLMRRFPHDPEVLYVATHAYSDLSIRASNQLLASAPASVQVHELNAEALESMGKWNEAAQEYQAILSQHPDTPGIHYRLGRLLLSDNEPSEAAKQQAKHEFEEELKIDPHNAGASFVLGELARQAEDWPTAIKYFSAAAQNDSAFFDAYLGLGRAYIGDGESAKAVAPLETAEKLRPDNAEVHFQLASAYRHSGRIADAEREAKLHQQVMDNANAARDRLHQQITGSAAAPASH